MTMRIVKGGLVGLAIGSIVAWFGFQGTGVGLGIAICGAVCGTLFAYAAAQQS